MRILQQETISITIDFQEKLMPSIYDNEKILKRTQLLLKGLNVLGVPNMVTRQYPKGLGDSVEEIKELTLNDPIYNKLAFSCYDDENIKKAIDAHNKPNIIILGVEAHVCVLQTIIDLKCAHYNVILVEDCVSSRSLSDKKTALVRSAAEGAIITTSESILFELTRIAGNDKFKEISKIIKG